MARITQEPSCFTLAGAAAVASPAGGAAPTSNSANALQFRAAGPPGVSSRAAAAASTTAAVHSAIRRLSSTALPATTAQPQGGTRTSVSRLPRPRPCIPTGCTARQERFQSLSMHILRHADSLALQAGNAWWNCACCHT